MPGLSQSPYRHRKVPARADTVPCSVREQKINPKSHHGKSSHAAVLQDFQLLLGISPGRERIFCVHIAIHVDPPGNPERKRSQNGRRQLPGNSKKSAAQAAPYRIPPMTAPTSGKKHMTYSIEDFSQSACGTGILEYILKAIRKTAYIFHTVPSPFSSKGSLSFQP